MKEIVAEEKLGLEVRTWIDLLPDYRRSFRMMNMFFVFTMVVVSVVLVFLIFNTVHMGVVERTREIGTLRAMGLTRTGVVRGFLQEGIVLGLVGAGAGILLGLAVGASINAAEITYQPPTIPYFAKLEVFVLEYPTGMLIGFFGCAGLAVLASLPAAWRGARLEIADALRDS